jgi:NADPH:quinone reductase-like Zn-dependent oxidoreductase
VNYKRHPNWADEVLRLTEARGVDHVIEVGGPGGFAQSLSAVRREGQINVIGYLGGTEGTINPRDIFRRQVHVRGIPVGSRASFEAMNRAIEVNEHRPVIDRVFPWVDAAERSRGVFLHLRLGTGLSHWLSSGVPRPIVGAGDWGQKDSRLIITLHRRPRPSGGA